MNYKEYSTQPMNLRIVWGVEGWDTRQTWGSYGFEEAEIESELQRAFEVGVSRDVNVVQVATLQEGRFTDPGYVLERLVKRHFERE